MKIVKYEVAGYLNQLETGPEAQVGDQVKLFLDQEGRPDLPEFIFSVIQPPIRRIKCGDYTEYSFEYDETDIPSGLIRPDDIISVEVVAAVDVVAADLQDEIERATAAEAVLQDHIDEEEAARIAADAALDGRLDILEVDAVRYTAQTNSDARELVARTNIGLGADVINPINRTLLNASSAVVVAWDNTTLEVGGFVSVNWGSRELQDSTGNESLSWQDRILVASVGGAALDWEQRNLNDSSGSFSLNWSDRELKNSSETPVLNWTNGLSVPDSINFTFGTTVGTKIGSAVSEKFAFHNSTPVIQRAGAAQAAVPTTAITISNPPTQAEVQAVVARQVTIETLVNELRAAMVEKGLIKGSA